jgi:hypothetical protein
MDVSLRHWPIFATGLLLGAAGTMSLGLQHPTQRELAALAPPAAAAPPATLAQVGPDADEQMRAAAEAFRAQEALAAAATPLAIAQVQPPKPRVRRVVKEADADSVAADSTTAPPTEPVTRLRSATSVMGGAPAPRSEPAEVIQERVEAARGSAHAAEGAEARAQSD